MSSSSLSLTVREATASDRDDVIRIHDNVYDGLDYIAEYYDDFIACPLTTPYVAIVNNNIVGFVAAFIVDEGKTVITRAGRLSPKVGGRGLYKEFHAHVLKASGAFRHAFLTSNLHPAAEKESFRSINRLILSKPLTRFLFDTSRLESMDTPKGKLPSATDKDIEHYFSSPAIKAYLFPKERLIVDWVPFRLTNANIPLLHWSRDRTKVTSDVMVHTDGHISGLLTFSTTLPVKRPSYNCNLNIYGTDTTTLKDHVISHVQNIRDKANGVASILVFVEPNFDMQALEDAFKNMGIEKSEWRDSENPEQIFSKQLLFEKEL